MTTENETEQAEPFRPIGELRDAGLLWLINRVVFHPRGFALAFDVADCGDVNGWKLLGDGSEVWTFDNESDDEEFAKVRATFHAISQRDSGEVPR